MFYNIIFALKMYFLYKNRTSAQKISAQTSVTASTKFGLY